MGTKIDMTGQRFGLWTVISEVDERHNNNIYWLCRCDCGTEKSVEGSSLRQGISQSCGCAPYDNPGMTHGLSKLPEYKIWIGARRRCNSPTHAAWKDYGGRGITFDTRWDDFAVFIADVGRRPTPKHSLDRINNDGPYAPGNVRWATTAQQQANRRIAVNVKDIVAAGLITWEQVNEVRILKSSTS